MVSDRTLLRYVAAGVLTVLGLTAKPVLSYFMLILVTGDIGGPLNLWAVPAGSCLFSGLGTLLLAVPVSGIMEYLLAAKLHPSPRQVWLIGFLVFATLSAVILVVLFARQMPLSDPTLGAVAYFFSGVLSGVVAGPVFWTLLRLLARAGV